MSVRLVHSVRDRIECMRVRPLLQPFLDGELDGPQRDRLVSHLEACHRCGLAASTYSTIIDHLHRFGQPAEPEAVARLEAFVDDLDSSGGADGRDDA